MMCREIPSSLPDLGLMATVQAEAQDTVPSQASASNAGLVKQRQVEGCLQQVGSKMLLSNDRTKLNLGKIPCTKLALAPRISGAVIDRSSTT